jgi:cytochrome c oxidase cbb3-type subunit 4
MDYGTLRGIFAALIFILFIIIVIWAFSRNRKGDFDNAANSIFEKDNTNKENQQETNNNV